MEDVMITMRSALLVSAVCILLYILFKRMAFAMRKSETRASYALVNRLESTVKDGELVVEFEVPVGFRGDVHISVLDEQGNVSFKLQDGPCAPGRHSCACKTEGWKGRYVLLLKADNQQLERFVEF
jgi:hypothetical protein